MLRLSLSRCKHAQGFGSKNAHLFSQPPRRDRRVPSPYHCHMGCFHDLSEVRRRFCFALFFCLSFFFPSFPSLCLRRLTRAVAAPRSGVMARIKLEFARLKKYGWYGVGTLAAVDVVTLGMIYAALSSGFDIGE